MPFDLVSVAPMIGCTDRHFRYLARLISSHTLLYTEMITVQELVRKPARRLSDFELDRPPVAIQLGGGDPNLLAQCVQLMAPANLAEINLNVGCPSERVQNGMIGACLMRVPSLVAECIEAMAAVSSVPLTVTCRLGVDELDSYDHLASFIQTVSEAGCQKFIIHARKAWLKGLSPKQNRNIPPLNYEMAYQLKKDFSHLTLILNGGISSVESIKAHLNHMDGVMLGRAVYSNPFILAEIEECIYGQRQQIDEYKIVNQYIEYVEEEIAKGCRLPNLVRHLLGFFYKKPNANAWRKYLSCNSTKKNAGVEVIKAALEELAA
jgi:tRNA-dihydrouridine synthase A